MNNLNIYTESFNYKVQNLEKMTKSELEEELKDAEKDIHTLQLENNSDGNYRTYIIEDRIKEAENYKKHIEDKLKEFKDDSSTNEPKIKDDLKDKYERMIQDLDRQKEKGTISKEYHDKYVKKLRDTIENLDYETDVEESVQEKKNRFPFKKFKSKLTSYRKKE